MQQGSGKLIHCKAQITRMVEKKLIPVGEKKKQNPQLCILTRNKPLIQRFNFSGRFSVISKKSKGRIEWNGGNI